MIFIQTRDEKFHIAELSFHIGELYCGAREDWIPMTRGRSHWGKQQLPARIRLCGICLVRFNSQKAS
jgi:hypothetical protein